MRYALTIRYENMHDLRQALTHKLEDLNSLETLGVDEVHIQELIEVTQRRAKEEMGLDVVLSSPSEVKKPVKSAPKAVEIVAPAEPEIDYDEFKKQAIERLHKIYITPGGAQLIDRLIRTHGGGATLFTKIAADKFPLIMADVAKEFPNA